MDVKLDTQGKHLRKIEDIIDIQKANGIIRQVAFKLPSETNSSLSFNIGKSLDTGLPKAKSEENTKKEKIRQKHQKDSDVISWPSDSDITVLRMKLGTNATDKMDNVALGDGLHQPRTSSMVNLATLLQSQRESKYNLVEECLLPLTSWEHAIDLNCPDNKKKSTIEYISRSSNFKNSCNVYSQNDIITEGSTKSKVARFLRLYFCPCCSCLYELEKMQDERPRI